MARSMRIGCTELWISYYHTKRLSKDIEREGWVSIFSWIMIYFSTT